MNTPAPNRREFLQAAAVTAIVPMLCPSTSTAASPARRPWKWAPEPGLWETACGDDVVAQLHAAADVGFAAFADPQLGTRSPFERSAIIQTARRHNLSLGPLFAFPYGMPGESVRRLFEVGAECGIPGFRIEQGPQQMPTVCLKYAETRSLVAQGLRDDFDRQTIDAMPALPILFEPHMCAECDRDGYEYWAEIVHEVNHPLCRLSADTYHLASAGIDVVPYLKRHAAILGHVELADYPGGFEPGSGTLDIAGIVAATALSPHDGVIGLRCGLSRPGQAGLNRLIAAARHHGGLREEQLA